MEIFTVVCKSVKNSNPVLVCTTPIKEIAEIVLQFINFQQEQSLAEIIIHDYAKEMEAK